jgi:hypothetical protein
MKTFSPIESIKSFSPLDDEEEIAPTVTKTFSPVEKRESQHLKQFGAGILDIGAGIPALAGLIATPFKAGYHAIADDTGLKDSFVKGLDNPAMRLSGDMHEGINDLVGVEDPEGLEQLSRLGSMLIPLGTISKGAGILSKVANSAAGRTVTTIGKEPSALLGAAKAAAPYVLPFIQTTEGASKGVKAAQAAAQVGLTVGADQGIRYGLDMPTITSSYSEIDDSLIENPGKTALGAAALAASIFVGSNALAQKAANAKRLADSVGTFGSVPNNPLAMPKIGGIDPLNRLDGAVSDIYSVTRRQVEEITGQKDTADDIAGYFKGDPGVAAGALMVKGEFPGSAIRVAQRDTYQEIKAREIKLSPEDSEVYRQFVAAQNEKATRVTATMAAVNPNLDDAGSMTARFQSHRDATVSRINVKAKKIEGEIASAQQAINAKSPTAPSLRKYIFGMKGRLKLLEEDLKFWNTFGTAPTVKGFDGKVWQIAPDGQNPSIFADNVPMDKQLEFLKSIRADFVETGLVVGNRQSPFLNAGNDTSTSLATMTQINNALKAGKQNAAVMDIVGSQGRLTDNVLSFMVEQGYIDEATAGLWRRNATLGSTLFHTMNQEAIAPDLGMIARMKYILGWDTPQADEFTRPLLTQLYKNAGGIGSRAKEVFNSAAVQVAKEKDNFEKATIGAVSRQALDAGQGVKRPMNPMDATKNYLASAIEAVMQNKARAYALHELGENVTPKMIGDTANVDDSRIFVRYATRDPQRGTIIKESIDKEVESAILTRAKTDRIDEVIKQSMIEVRVGGKIEVWYVPSKTMQRGLSHHSGITTGLNRIGALQKNLYQRGTTRNIFFAPLQAAYSGMLQFLNAPANGLFYHIGDMMKGINEVFKTSLANEMANHIDRLAVTSPLFRDSKFLQSFKNTLRESVQKSLMLEIYARAGSGAKSSTAIDSMTRTAKLGDDWIGALEMKAADGATYNLIKGIYRVVSIVSRSLQDGPLVGLEMKAMNKALKEGYLVNSRPTLIDGVKIKYASPTRVRADGTIPPASYNRDTNTITIDVDRLKTETYKRVLKDGWQEANPAFAGMPHRFDNEDDFAEFVLQHELAHARQMKMGTPPLAQNASGSMFRLYRGVGKNMGPAGDTAFFTTNLAKAKHYGDVSYVDVDMSKQGDGMKFIQGHGGPDEYVTEIAWIKDRLKPFSDEAPAPFLTKDREIQANSMATDARSLSRAKAARKANIQGKDIGGDYLAYGDSESVRAIRAWVPFSGAAIQGLRALGGAMAKHPAKTTAMIGTAIVIPAIAELSFLYQFGSEEQKEAYWRQADSTRVSNMMFPNPDGKTFTQLPIEPTMRMIRAITLEMLDGMTNASNPYRPYKNEIADGAEVETGQFGHAVMTGLQSAIGLPFPPIAQAYLAASGYQGTMGVDPNAESFMAGVRPLAGQQVTAMGKDDTSMPNGVLSKAFEGVIVAFTGAIGAMGLSAFNQFTLGKESDLEERTERAAGEIGTKLLAYSRVGQLFGLDETVKTTTTSHIDKELRVMIRGLKSMQAIEQSALAGGQMAGGVTPAGNAPLAPDDHNQVMAAANAAMIAKNPRFIEAGMKISTALKQRSIIKGSDRAQPDNVGMLPWLKAGEPFTREMKYRAEQQLANIINQERVMQLYLMKEHEEMTGVKFADFAGRSPPIHLDSPFAQPSGMFEEDGSYIPTPEAQPSQ